MAGRVERPRPSQPGAKNGALIPGSLRGPGRADLDHGDGLSAATPDIFVHDRAEPETTHLPAGRALRSSA